MTVKELIALLQAKSGPRSGHKDVLVPTAEFGIDADVVGVEETEDSFVLKIEVTSPTDKE